MSDVVPLLRKDDDWLTHKAADEIERLRAEHAAAKKEIENLKISYQEVKEERDQLYWEKG